MTSIAQVSPLPITGGPTVIQSSSVPSSGLDSQNVSSQPTSSQDAQAPVASSVPTSFRPGYPNNRVTIDPSFDKTIVEFLNPATGAVVQQLPARHVVQLYETANRTRRVQAI